MSYPNLLENGNKNENVSTPLTSHEEIVIKNEEKETNKSRIAYYTILASISLLSMLVYVWKSPFMKTVTIAGSDSPATGITNKYLMKLSSEFYCLIVIILLI